MFTMTEIFCLNGKKKKPPSIPIGTKVVAMRESDCQDGTFLRLVLDSQLCVGYNLSWHAVFLEYISFHVSLAFSQDL